MRPVPHELTTGVFTRARALDLDLTSRMLQGDRFVRVLPEVWRHRDHEMSEDDWIAAARLVLPDDAHLTGLTRLRRLGLDYGPSLPVRFVVARDHHLAYGDVFLHRTERLPPLDDVGVTPPAAFTSYCAHARVIDAIKVGDWLLHHQHLTRGCLRDFALAEPWRAGAVEVLWLLDHLDGQSRSLPESETRAVLEFAKLPRPEVNGTVALLDGVEIVSDLVYARWRQVVEYEGGHHQTDRDQYGSDIDRYALMRAADVAYVQVTKEKLARARTLVGEVHRALLRRGYDGPPPDVGPGWAVLFRPIHTLIDRDDRRRARAAVG
jgi:hypothetical protein